MNWRIADPINIMLLGMSVIGPAAEAPVAGNSFPILSYDSSRRIDMSLLITMELNIPSDSWAKRPYIAVWIEDTNGMTVRTLALWYSNPRWLPELRAWYRRNSRHFTVDKRAFGSVTSATRSPGRYTLKWDGKDDNGRNAVTGQYVVCIETAREHNMFQAKGTYTFIRKEIFCGEVPEKIDVPGNAEIKAASLVYAKKVDEDQGHSLIKR